MIGEVNNINKRKKDVEDKLTVLDDLRKSRTGPVRMLDALATATPKKVWLTDFDEKANAVKMTGSAVSHEDVAEFMRGLQSMVWTPQGHGAAGRAEARRDDRAGGAAGRRGRDGGLPAPRSIANFFTSIDLKKAESKAAPDGRSGAPTHRGVRDHHELELRHLGPTMDELIDKILKAPPLQRSGAGWPRSLVVLTVVNFFLFVAAELDDASEQPGGAAAAARHAAAREEEIAQNLNERRREMDVLEQKLAEALTELPEHADIDELLAQLNDIGRKAGLEISAVEPAPEESGADSSRKIPIKMTRDRQLPRDRHVPAGRWRTCGASST